MKNIFANIETAVLGMVVIRLISGTIELCAASMMWKFNSVEKAVAINALLSLVGPVVLITSMAVGLIGMADRLSAGKLIFIALGVLFILIGIKK